MRKFKSISVSLLCIIVAVASIICVCASEEYKDDETPRVIDNAEVLSESDEVLLENELLSLKKRYNMDYVILTVLSTDGKSMRDFADDYYDYNGYGEDFSNRDGVILVLNFVENREAYISTRGDAIEVFTDYGIEKIFDEIVPFLSDGKYTDALEKYVSLCDEYSYSYKSGNPVDINEKKDFNLFASVLISLAVGFAIALITLLIWKNNLKSVRPKVHADDYYADGTLDVSRSRDVFLYSNVIRVRKSEDSPSEGGSSTHTSSSGATHGGGGRSF